jgi:phage shock protein A
VGVSRRIALLFRAKAGALLDRAEDPREVLDYSYGRQLELLARVRRGAADVATSRKRLELQLRQLRQAETRLGAQAEEAVAKDLDDLAREALTRRAATREQAVALESQRAALEAEERKLVAAADRLQAKIEAFRARKETVKAEYTAAQAQTRINEALTGISEEMGDIGLAMSRAEDKTAQLQARSAALDELIESGVLHDASLPAPSDDLRARLEAAPGGTIDQELAALKPAPEEARS